MLAVSCGLLALRMVGQAEGGQEQVRIPTPQKECEALAPWPQAGQKCIGLISLASNLYETVLARGKGKQFSELNRPYFRGKFGMNEPLWKIINIHCLPAQRISSFTPLCLKGYPHLVGAEGEPSLQLSLAHEYSGGISSAWRYPFKEDLATKKTGYCLLLRDGSAGMNPIFLLIQRPAYTAANGKKIRSHNPVPWKKEIEVSG
ncbi:hypothetical protein HGM15179_000593 [Zosterops borbonicus]|uniref:Uncharacterized protein n=1 Tax=Zosterops borbonicus TaxID=364589 RepID=A0A8K1GWC6_9PASS|nr:hypothetical protein HGM15179_000593 [Zosterops borbonicus]